MTTTDQPYQNSAAARILAAGKSRCCQCRPPDWQMMKMANDWYFVEVCRKCSRPAPVASPDPRLVDRWRADGGLTYTSPERKAANEALLAETIAAAPTSSRGIEITDAMVDAANAVLWLPQRFACWAETQKVAARPLTRSAIIAALNIGAPA